MALQLINVGTTSNDGTGDTLRTAGQKMNANASELFGLVADTQGALGEKLEADALTPFETSTQLTARDTANRDRANHTGTQSAATIIDLAQAAAAAAPVQSVAGKTGLVSLAKADVGLGQVDNTADLSKPISTATEAALTALTSSDTAQDNAIAGLILSDTEQDNAIATFETTTQLDARDTANRARGNHTGTQAASTVSGLATVATSGAYGDLSERPTIPAGFTYDQQAEPVGPTAGQTWRERNAGGLIIGEWVWSGSLWLSVTNTFFSAHYSNVVGVSGNNNSAIQGPRLDKIVIVSSEWRIYNTTGLDGTNFYRVEFSIVGGIPSSHIFLDTRTDALEGRKTHAIVISGNSSGYGFNVFRSGLPSNLYIIVEVAVKRVKS